MPPFAESASENTVCISRTEVNASLNCMPAPALYDTSPKSTVGRRTPSGIASTLYVGSLVCGLLGSS